MDPILNCLTGACCPPAERKAIMAKALMEYCKCDQGTANTVAGWMMDTFDLAPAGTLLPFVQEIVRLSKNVEKA